MGTNADHRRYAEECVARAQRAEGESDKALWLTLAQSWARLAEYVAHGAPELAAECMPDAGPANPD
jgi:hypothetical protein